jgi:flagellar basal body-associated protein FliL
MAQDTAEETKPATETEGAAEPATKPKSQGMMPLLLSSVILAVVLGGVGFALAYFVVPARMAAASATVSTTPAAAAPAAAAGAPTGAAPAPEPEKTARSAAEMQSDGGKAVTKFTIEEITVNIADTKGNRFVRAGVYFEAEPAVLEELEANRARMIDTLGQVLSTKTLDELTSPNIRGMLREELLGIINPTLKAGRVDNLYFTDLLVQ